jgi:putative FmdB family regulatory protein
MPTYEYRCPDGHLFERFQRMSDPPEADCPTCAKPGERRISGGGGFLFKGDGFYITDYRSDEYRAQAKKEAGESGGAGGSAPTPAAGASSTPASASSSAPAAPAAAASSSSAGGGAS